MDKISVKFFHKNFEGLPEIPITIRGRFICDTINEPMVMFWLSPKEADSLAFHLQAALQDYEISQKAKV